MPYCILMLFTAGVAGCCFPLTLSYVLSFLRLSCFSFHFELGEEFCYAERYWT